MTIPDDWKKTVRRNKLLGMWAAEKLGITGRDAEAYSDALAVGTLDPEAQAIRASLFASATTAAFLCILRSTCFGDPARENLDVKAS